MSRDSSSYSCVKSIVSIYKYEFIQLTFLSNFHFLTSYIKKYWWRDTWFSLNSINYIYSNYIQCTSCCFTFIRFGWSRRGKPVIFLLRLFFKQGKKNLHFIWHKKIPHNTIKPKYLLLNTTFQPLILYVFYISSRYYHNLIECSKYSRIFVEFLG